VTSFITVDLDSTLADTTHRHHMIDRVNGTDWVAYSKACVDDKVIMATESLVWGFARLGVQIHYLTGRVEEARPETETWLKKNGLPNDGLWMDDQPDRHGSKSHSKYKRDRIIDVIVSLYPLEHLFHIDDWPDVKVALEEADIPCLCVRTPEEIEAFMLEKTEGPR
jgi:hypothetical protein